MPGPAIAPLRMYLETITALHGRTLTQAHLVCVRDDQQTKVRRPLNSTKRTLDHDGLFCIPSGHMNIMGPCCKKTTK